MEVKEMANLNLASLLDASIDDLADLPSLEAPPTGAYVLDLKISTRKINEKDAVGFDYEIIEVLEVVDQEKYTEAELPKQGQKFSEAFILGNEYAVGRLKQSLKPISAHYGVTSIRDVIAAGEAGIRIAATVKRRVDKEDPDKKYASVSNIQVQ